MALNPYRVWDPVKMTRNRVVYQNKNCMAAMRSIFLFYEFLGLVSGKVLVKLKNIKKKRSFATLKFYRIDGFSVRFLPTVQKANFFLGQMVEIGFSIPIIINQHCTDSVRTFQKMYVTFGGCISIFLPKMTQI